MTLNFSQLAILDYLNNAHDAYSTRIPDYEEVAEYGVGENACHVFNLYGGVLFVYVLDRGFFYEFRDTAINELIESGEITTLKQLRDFHLNR